MKTSLEHKTIRPGSLSDYSFYYSNRSAPAAENRQPAEKPVMSKTLTVFIVLLLALVAGYMGFTRSSHSANSAAPSGDSSAIAPIQNTASPAACAGNTLDKFIRVSIGQRRLWACSGHKVAYSTSVITGMEMNASTLTPPGTYKIYAKQQNTVLTGKDVTGSWRDPVSYWMPFLDNQYGTYGFHDATWRNPAQFGKITANSDQASHGCVELPIGSAQWLYNWAQVGTTLTIAS